MMMIRQQEMMTMKMKMKMRGNDNNSNLTTMRRQCDDCETKETKKGEQRGILKHLLQRCDGSIESRRSQFDEFPLLRVLSRGERRAARGRDDAYPAEEEQKAGDE